MWTIINGLHQDVRSAAKWQGEISKQFVVSLAGILSTDFYKVYRVSGSIIPKVSKGAKIRNRYNQVTHLTQDTNGKVTNSQLDTTNENQALNG